jgi:hypothetical protein
MSPQRLKKQREYNATHKEMMLASKRKYAEKYKEELKVYKREWEIANKDKLKPHKAKYYLKKTYNLTPEQLEIMVQAQQGVCAICKQPERQNTRLSIDHNHQTGKIRGLLCRNCNAALGAFKDNPLYLQIAIDYLNYHDSRET